MFRRRIDLLEPLAQELNPNAFVVIWKQVPASTAILSCHCSVTAAFAIRRKHSREYVNVPRGICNSAAELPLPLYMVRC